MDSKQLILIATTAVVTAFAKTLVEAVVSFTKKLVSRVAGTPHVRSLMGRPKDWAIIGVSFDLLMVGTGGIFLWTFLDRAGPVGRSEILTAIYYSCVVLFWGNKFLNDSLAYIVSRLTPQNKPNQAEALD